MVRGRKTSGIFSSLIFLFMVIVSASFLWAALPSVKFGIKAGGGLANIFGQDTFDQKWQESLACGIFLDLTIYQKFRAGTEVIFFRKGSIYRLNVNQIEYREKLILDYLEIPVFLKLYFFESSRYRFYLYGGPSAGFNLKARLKVTFDGLEESVEVDNLKGTDYLINAGTGAELKLKSGFIVFELRYNYGLKSISTETEGDVRNKSLVLLAGYRF